jgi:maltose alpha-D-glucosyltransferase/alpha-amylase
MRKECPEISWGDFEVIKTSAPAVLAIRYDWRNTSLLTMHNFAKSAQTVRLNVGRERGDLLVDVFNGHHSHSQNDGVHRVKLEPYAWRWFRVGAADNTLHLSDLLMTDSQVK